MSLPVLPRRSWRLPRRVAKRSSHKKGPPEPWASFLRALDSRLSEPAQLHCIGGFVVTMQFGVSRTTADIDVLPTSSQEILSRVQQIAGFGSELHRQFKVYIQPVGVVTYPESYSSRLIRMWPRFKLEHVRLYALEPHDLALTKLERNQD